MGSNLDNLFPTATAESPPEERQPFYEEIDRLIQDIIKQYNTDLQLLEREKAKNENDRDAIQQKIDAHNAELAQLNGDLIQKNNEISSAGDSITDLHQRFNSFRQQAGSVLTNSLDVSNASFQIRFLAELFQLTPVNISESQNENINFFDKQFNSASKNIDQKKPQEDGANE